MVRILLCNIKYTSRGELFNQNLARNSWGETLRVCGVHRVKELCEDGVSKAAAMRAKPLFLDASPELLKNRKMGIAEEYKEQAKKDGIPNRAKGLFDVDDQVLKQLSVEAWPFEKHLPGEGSPYEMLPEGGWITGAAAIERGIDLRLYYKEPEDEGIHGWVLGAVRFGDGSSIGAGFKLPAHGGAIETVLDEATAEVGKMEAFPFLATREISFKIIKSVPLHTTLLVRCQVQKVKGLKCWVTGQIEYPNDGVVLASCEAVLVNMAAFIDNI